MKETILLFGFDEERRKKLARSLVTLRMRVKVIEKKEFGQPIGYLAGVKEVLSVDENTEKEVLLVDENAEKEILEGEMLVMAGLSSARVDQVLGAIRKSGVGPIPYKAVLTDTNQYWKAAELLAELKREHEKMSER